MGRFKHLKGLDLADNFESNEKPIDILIGGDYFYTFVGNRVIRGSYGPVAVETSFGYTLSGGILPKNTHSHAHANLSFTCLKAATSSDDLESKLSKFWSMEGLGIEKDSIDFVDSQIDKSIVFSDGKYFVSLPKRDDTALLGDNL